MKIDHASDLKFEFRYKEGIGSNDLWLMIDFQNYGAVNIGEESDSLEVVVTNTSFIVSVATLKPLIDITLDKNFLMTIPPLEPSENEVYE